MSYKNGNDDQYTSVSESQSQDSSSGRKRKNDSNDQRGGSKHRYRSDRDRERDRDHHHHSDEIIFKVLVPSFAAGGVIGRGGEKIAHIQKEANVKMKMSKANDYYPGTQERVCIMFAGSVSNLLKAHDYLVEKIKEKPLDQSKPIDEERESQTKMLIPNTTAGLLIGKNGVYIKQIKDDSGAFVQISPKQSDLSERIVTVEGEHEKRNKAIEMILKKICDDSQYYDSSTPLSYADYHSSSSSSAAANLSLSPNATGLMSAASNLLSYPSNILLGLTKLNELMQQQQHMSATSNMRDSGSGSSQQSQMQSNLQSSGLSQLSMLIMTCGGSNNLNPDNLNNALRGMGYGPSASNEIIDAIQCLFNYGLITKGSTGSSSTSALPSLMSNGSGAYDRMSSSVSSQNLSDYGGKGYGSQGSTSQSIGATQQPPSLLANSLLGQQNLGSLLQLLSGNLNKVI